MDLGLDIRKEVLTNALYLESFTSIFLAKLLGIEKTNETKSFGNAGSSLSFNAKINLLIDIGALQHNDRKKFQWFMEVRNQFMHNVQATNYVNCFSFLDSKNGVLKAYPQSPELSEEEQLQIAFRALTNDVADLTSNIIKKVEEHVTKQVEAEAHARVFEAMGRAIDLLEISLDAFIEKKINDPNFNAQSLKGLGRITKRNFYKLSERIFTELSASDSANVEASSSPESNDTKAN